MKLAEADKWAAEIRAQLAPMCEKIEIAGSIRRRRPEPNDIDLVILPLPEQAGAIRARCKRRNPLVLEDGGVNFLFKLRNDVQVDIFFAHGVVEDFYRPTPSNWGSLLVCRTGSPAFNVRLAQRAVAQGLHWNPYVGVIKKGLVIASETEEDVFKAVAWEWVKPEERE